MQAVIDAMYRTQSRRVLATLIRLLGSFDLAEEALHEAFRAALETWPTQGLPANPAAWLVSTGRFKAIDALRRAQRFEPWDDHAERIASLAAEPIDTEVDQGFDDDQLRLIFTCCHPALQQDARVALTLREVCGLTTEAIASAFLSSPATMAQRIVRAKSKIRDAGIPYEVPAPPEWPDRLESVLQVIYLVFNEGYAASHGAHWVRAEISTEAVRLARLLLALTSEADGRTPGAPVQGLLALMLLHESRRSTRQDDAGDLVLLADQDRSRWDRALIDEADALLTQALSDRRAPCHAYTVQAAIAAVHAQAPRADETDWAQIVALYEVLLAIAPSPVVELNRAVAVAMHRGPDAGLLLIDALMVRDALPRYHLLHAARAELLRRRGDVTDSRAAYTQAMALVRNEPERRFLQARLAGLPTG